MNVFIGHESALEYWRSISLDTPGSYPRAHKPPPYAQGVIGGRTYAPFRLEQHTDFLPLTIRKTPSFSEGGHNSEDLENIARFTGGVASEPVSLIATHDYSRRNSSRAQYHTHGSTFPSNSFVRLGKKTYISSPELCFLQMASSLPFAELLLLGFEFCGSYTTHQEGYERRPPLSSVARIRAYLDRASSMHGIKAARRALKYLADGSASPKESQLALLLGLPRAMGGYGLGIPLMNKEITFARGARKATDSTENYTDLYWPEAKLAVEYDSDLAHLGPEEIAHDAARRNALIAAGVDVITITKKQLMSYSEMEKAAYAIARRMNVRMRSRADDEVNRRLQLRWELLRHTTR